MYLPFSPHRPRIHCSIDVLYHEGVLVITHAVGAHRAKR
jgi:hypothetical protein